MDDGARNLDFPDGRSGRIHLKNEPVKHRRIRRLSDVEKSKSRNWLVRELIESGGSLLLVGEEGTGKSTIAAELAASVVTGRPFFGAVTQKGAVLYIAAEKEQESCRRLRTILTEAEQSAVGIMGRVDLFGEPAAARQIIDEASELFAKADLRLAMIILDTVGAAMGAGDENLTRDAKRLCDALDTLRRTGAAVVIVHHAKRDEGRSRGSQYFPAWADSVVRIDKRKNGRTFKVTKSNVVSDDSSATTFAVEGRPIDPENPGAGTVAVAVEVAGEGANRAPPRRPLGRDQADALSALRDLTPTGAPIALETWRQECVRRWNKPKPGSAREAWRALISPEDSRLRRENLIVMTSETVAPVRASGERQETSGFNQRQASGAAAAPL